MSIAIGEPIENELNEKRKPSLDQDTKLTMATTSLTEQIASTPSQENQFEIQTEITQQNDTEITS